ncbi:galactarate dehydratase [Nitrincola nitratireducens]|uniref:Galactarate dehydratase n=1 Tax=Nitrincola nitratireducens TaxID=1229521 RepID=W9UZ14_9GAMM|nr:galactarate dehydratase [Nitrincola nitratireducens]EXJ12478.1 D-galactarate dehydratase [Nitrincola nitratireducens]
MNRKIIQITDVDNVAIVVNPEGLAKGESINDVLSAAEAVPQGHKVALCGLVLGQEIIRYGEVIGYALKDIPEGAWIQESMVRLPTPPDLKSLPIATRPAPVQGPLEGYTFEGYRNPDGSVGTRNILAISTSVQCVAGMTNLIVEKVKKDLLPLYPYVDDVVALNHAYGCGVAINAPDAVIPIRTLQNMAKNPNFGGEVMVIGLGCEKLLPERVLSDSPTQVLQILDAAAHVPPSARPTLSLQDESLVGFEAMISEIMEMAKYHLERLNTRRRETCPVSELVLGVQCGGSDAFSGVTANPAVGFASDLIVRAGGSVMFSEVTEVRDAIHLLSPRVINQEVGQALLDQMQWYDDYLNRGLADRSANPSPGNKKGGLSNVVEKALGSVVKSGSSQIVDVLGPGEKLRRKGLNFAATPASDFVCGTLQFASGMNVQIFTTGRGTPYGLAEVPVIKVATNSKLATRWFDLIDVDAGRIATGEATIESLGWELFHLVLDVASGRTEVAADRLGLHNDLVLFNPAPVT